MRLLADGAVYLEEGEQIPYCCPICGFLWQDAVPIESRGGKQDEVDVRVKCPCCRHEVRVAEMEGWIRIR